MKPKAGDGTCLSMEEAAYRRWEKLALTSLDTSLGSLWWAAESLWKETLGQRYDAKSTRQGHPALSIRKRPLMDLRSRVPVLHGTSQRGPVPVRGLSKESPPRTTFFGGLVAAFPLSEWVPPQVRRVTPNLDKPRLNEEEMESLNRLLQRRHLA